MYLEWAILEFGWSRRPRTYKEWEIMLGKEHLVERWRNLKAGNECRPDSLGNESLVNDFEQERWVRFATPWVCSVCGTFYC